MSTHIIGTRAYSVSSNMSLVPLLKSPLIDGRSLMTNDRLPMTDVRWRGMGDRKRDGHGRGRDDDARDRRDDGGGLERGRRARGEPTVDRRCVPPPE